MHAYMYVCFYLLEKQTNIYEEKSRMIHSPLLPSFCAYVFIYVCICVCVYLFIYLYIFSVFAVICVYDTYLIIYFTSIPTGQGPSEKLQREGYYKMKFYGKGMDKNGDEQIVKGGLNAMKVLNYFY